MGGRKSKPTPCHMYNNTSYVAVITFQGRTHTLHPGQVVFHSGQGSPEVSVDIYDRKGRLEKRVYFRATYDDEFYPSWVIQRQGIAKHKDGCGVHVADPRGPLKRWNPDNHLYYKNMDIAEEEAKERARRQEAQRKQDEERARREEKERQFEEAEDQRRTQEHQQMLEEERRQRQEAEEARIRQEAQDVIDRPLRASEVAQTLESETRNRWKQQHVASEERRELSEFSEINAKFVRDTDGANTNVDYTLSSSSSKTEMSPLGQMLTNLVNAYFFEQTETIPEDVAAAARSELISKIVQGKNIFFDYSSPTVHIQCLEAFAEIVSRQPAEYLVAYLNAFEAVAEEYRALPEKNEEVDHKMGMVLNRLTGHWELRMKEQSISQVQNWMFQSPEPPQPYGIHIVYKVRDLYNFPQNPETWSLFASIMKYNLQMARSPFIREFVEAKVSSYKYQKINADHRPAFLELLYCITFQQGQNFNEWKPITEFFKETAKYLVSVHDTEKNNPDAIGEYWVQTYVNSLIYHKKYKNIWNPVPHEFIQFWFITGSRLTQGDLNLLCSFLKDLANLSEDVKEIPIQADATTITKLLLEELIRSDGQLKLDSPPDFIIQCLIRERSRIDSEGRDVLLKCAARLKTLNTVSENCLQNLYSWFDDFGLSNMANTSRVLQLCQIILEGRNLNKAYFLKAVGLFTEKVLSKIASKEVDDAESDVHHQAMLTFSKLIQSGGYESEETLKICSQMMDSLTDDVSSGEAKNAMLKAILSMASSSRRLRQQFLPFWTQESNENLTKIITIASSAISAKNTATLFPALELIISIILGEGFSLEDAMLEEICNLLSNVLRNEDRFTWINEELGEITAPLLKRLFSDSNPQYMKLAQGLFRAMENVSLEILTLSNGSSSMDVIVGWIQNFKFISDPSQFLLNLHSAKDTAKFEPDEYQSHCHLLLSIITRHCDKLVLSSELAEIFRSTAIFGFDNGFYSDAAHFLINVKQVMDKNEHTTDIFPEGLQEILEKLLSSDESSHNSKDEEYEIYLQLWLLVLESDIKENPERQQQCLSFLKQVESNITPRTQEILLRFKESLHQSDDYLRVLANSSGTTTSIELIHVLLSGIENNELAQETRDICRTALSTACDSLSFWDLFNPKKFEELKQLPCRLYSADCADLANFLKFRLQLFVYSSELGDDAASPESIKITENPDIYSVLLEKMQEQKGDEINPFKLHKSWIFQFAKTDEISAIGFFNYAINSGCDFVLKYVMVAVGCSLAQLSFMQSNFTRGEVHYRQMLRYLVASNEEDNKSTAFDELLNTANFEENPKNNPLLAFLLVHRSLMQSKHGDLASALRNIHHPILTGTELDYKSCLEQFRVQVEFLNYVMQNGTGIETPEIQGGEENVMQKIGEMLSKLQILLNDNGFPGDSHVKLICGKLGPDIFTQEGVQFLDFALLLGEWYDVNVVANFPPQFWPSQLLRSELLSRLNQLLPESEWDDEDTNLEQNVADLWDFVLLSNNCIPVASHENFISLEALQKLTVVHHVFANIFDANEEHELTGNRIYIALLCLTVNSSTLETRMSSSIQELESLWLADRLKLDIISDEEVKTFWELISSSEFIASIPNMVFLDELLLNLNGTANLSEISKYIEFLNVSRRPISTLRDILHPFSNGNGINSNEEGQINLGKMQQETESFMIAKMVDNIFKDFFPTAEDSDALSLRRFFIYSNCKSLIGRLHSAGKWTLTNFTRLMSILEGKRTTKEERTIKDVEQFAQMMHAVYSYADSIPQSPEQVLDILDGSTDVHEWPNLIISCHLKGIQIDNAVKVRQDLFTEMINNNQGNPHILNNLQTSIPEIMAEIDAHTWSKDQLSWKESNKGDFTLAQKVSKLCQAIKLSKGYGPRDTQVLSLLTLILKSDSNGGRLAQIATGEGKSIIVAMLSAFMAMEGCTVDVVTSSPILGQRDVQELKEFYNMLNVSVESLEGSEPQMEQRKPKACYSSQVLYGDASSFQSDVLRHEFSLLGTRGNRGFQVVIVDEVDCMLIDQGGHSTRLVDKMPGMDHLEPVLVAIWAYLNAEIGTIVTLVDGRSAAFSDILNTTTTTSWIEAVLKVDGRGLNIRLQDLNRIALENKNREKEDPSAKAAIADLVQAGVILLPSDLSDNQVEHAKLAAQSEEGITPENCGNLIGMVIDKRWNTDTDAVKLKVLEMQIGKRINIYAPNNNTGAIELSSDFYNFQSPRDDYDNQLLLLNINGRYFNLTIVPDVTAYIKSTVISKTKKLFRFSTKDYEPLAADITKEIKIPHHLSALYYYKLNSWVESALTAKLHIVENRDYVVKLDSEGRYKVVPIDFESTGVIQEGTVWSDGLHQFLQLRHGLTLSPENLATNFLSNMAFFNRYASNIYGLTGTLGSEPEKTLLTSTYNVDTVAVPTFKVKLHSHLEDIVAPSSDHWLSAITTSVQLHTRNRAVLVICRSINDVNRIETYLNQHMIQVETNVGRYTRSDFEAEAAAVTTKFKMGRVLLATNLAGRGTDIKLVEEVVANGGLHVVITFLPKNLRVEHQAAGRAARQGQPGSSQLILNAETDLNEILADLDDPCSPSPKNVKELRGLQEVVRVQKIQSDTIPLLREQEKAFNRYCKERALVQSCESLLIGYRDKHQLAALDEKWGIMLSTTVPSPASFSAGSGHFFNNLSTCLNNPNPYYDILRGNDANCRDSYDDAIKCYDDAIRTDGVFVANAHYFKAYSIIQKFNREDYKEKGAECLNKAASLLGSNVIPSLLAMHQLGSKRNEEGEVREFEELKQKGTVVVTANKDDSDFTRQVVNKISIFQVQLKSIEDAFKKMEEYKTIEAELVGIEDYFSEKGVSLPQSEVDEYRDVGLLGFIKIIKKTPPWYVYFVVILVGVVQVIAGAAIAICTGGAFGTGFIADGIGDIAKGIKAAVDGEDISLGDFFKEKAISLAISAVASVAGAALSSAAGAIRTFAVKMVTKFANSGLGKLVIKFGKAAQTWALNSYNNAKDWILKATTGLRNWATGIGTSASSWASNMGDKMLQWGQNMASALKLDKAWEYLKKGYGTLKEKVENAYKKVRDSLSPLLGEGQKTQLKLAGRLIGYEVAKTGLLMGMDEIINRGVLTPLSDAIKDKLQADLASRLSSAMQYTENLVQVQAFFAEAKTIEEFNQIWVDFQRLANNVAGDFSTDRSEAAERTFEALNAFSSEVKRIMGNEKNKMGHRNIIAAVVTVSTTIAIESAKFANMVRLLRLYLPTVLENLKIKLNENRSQTAPLSESDSYCLSRRGRMDLTACTNSVADSMAEIMAAKMAAMIESGIISPALQIGVDKLADLINPFKQDDILDAVENNQVWKGNEGRVGNASIWDTITNKAPIGDISKEDKKLVRKDGQDFDARKDRNLERKSAYNFDKSVTDQIFKISSNLDSPVQIYSNNFDGSSVQLSASIGAGKASAPIKLYTEDGGLSFNPIVVEDGRCSIVPMQNTSRDLLTSSLVGLSMQGTMSQASLAEFVYKMKTSASLPSGFKYGLKEMNVLRLASFKVEG